MRGQTRESHLGEPATINLSTINFTQTETPLATYAGLRASAFRYPSGVVALRIQNEPGEITVLPFHGQQIWDVTFHGRRLTMRSMFDSPADSNDYLMNYGGFLLHCGATAMGNPGPDDHHPLHGELPNARYQTAELAVGSDALGSFMELSGSYRHTVAFSCNYVARPAIRMYANSTRLKLSFALHNLKHSPMEFMYLAHVNFRPVDGAKLIDTVPDDLRHIRLRTHVPRFFQPTQSHRNLIEALNRNPSLHRSFTHGQTIDPELVMGLTCEATSDGWAHSMQLLPDGTADYLSHRPDELSHAARWITRTADQDALGLLMPGTAEANGFIAEKAKGNVRILQADETFHCNVEFGVLNREEAAKMGEACRTLLDQKPGSRSRI